MNSTWSRGLNAALVVILAVLCVRAMFRSAHDASSLRITPDEVEYALAAREFVRHGDYSIDFGAEKLPPSSSPWFSIGVLAPAYLCIPNDIGAGIYAVLTVSVLGLLALFVMGTRVSGPLGGTLAVIAVLRLGKYPQLAQYVLTDAPAAALALATIAWLLRQDASSRLRSWWLAGALIASAFALRSIYLALFVPAVVLAYRCAGSRLARIAALLAPSALVIAATWIYQAKTFGDWSRSGYQVWKAVPYDYPSLVWSLVYIPKNLAVFRDASTSIGFVALGVGVRLALARREAPTKRMALASLACVLPITLFFLGYFFVDPRMHLLAQTLGLGLAGVSLAVWLPLRGRIGEISALIAAVLACALPPQEFPRDESRRALVDAITSQTPADALIISNVESCYLLAFEPEGSHRTFLAWSRAAEFASKLLTPERVANPDPPPRDAFDHRCAGLLRSGAREVIEFTAEERPDALNETFREGRRVFVDRSRIPSASDFQRWLTGRFRVRALGTTSPLLELLPAK